MLYNDFVEGPQSKPTEFTGEEFIQIGEIARPFWERGISENPPKFVIVMGGIAAGKTTLRQHQYADGYVHFDYGEILNAIAKTVGGNHEKLASYVSLACDLILRESLGVRKNIVIEIIGESLAPITPIIQGMKELGYDISVNAVEADPEEARRRHLKAVEEDKSYLSAYYTQAPTLAVFYHVLGLGDMPSSADDR